MQTERVTFLTTPDHKAALDAFAADNGMSVGHVVREATSRYVAGGLDEDDERLLDEILPVLESSLARWQRQVDAMEASIARASDAIERALAGDPA